MANTFLNALYFYLSGKWYYLAISFYFTILFALHKSFRTMAMHRYVDEFRPLNLRVRLSVPCLEVPFEGAVSDEALALIFSVHCSKCARNIRRIIGDKYIMLLAAIKDCISTNSIGPLDFLLNSAPFDVGHRGKVFTKVYALIALQSHMWISNDSGVVSISPNVGYAPCDGISPSFDPLPSMGPSSSPAQSSSFVHMPPLHGTFGAEYLIDGTIIQSLISYSCGSLWWKGRCSWCVFSRISFENSQDFVHANAFVV